VPVTDKIRLSALMPHDQDAQMPAFLAINHRIGKRLERQNSAASRGWRSKTRMLKQKRDDVLKFIQKTCGHLKPGVMRIKVLRVSNVLFGSCMKRVIHRASRARNLVMTSSPGTNSDFLIRTRRALVDFRNYNGT